MALELSSTERSFMNPLNPLRPEGCSAELSAQPVRALGIDPRTSNATVAEVVWRPSDADIHAAQQGGFITSPDDSLPFFQKLLPLAETRQLISRRADPHFMPAQPSSAPAAPGNKLDFFYPNQFL